MTRENQSVKTACMLWRLRKHTLRSLHPSFTSRESRFLLKIWLFRGVPQNQTGTYMYITRYGFSVRTAARIQYRIRLHLSFLLLRFLLMSAACVCVSQPQNTQEKK